MENIHLSEVSEALASIGFAQTIPENKNALQMVIQATKETLDKYTLKQILNTNLDS